MLAIFLDESGIFEEENGRARLNAGIAYRGEDLASAIQNLNELLVEICENNDLVFPKGLHGRKIRDLELRRRIQKQLIQFLGKGKHWTIIGIVAGDYERDIRSNVIDEQQASNLYRNMLMRLLDNAIYYSPLAKDQEKVELYIARRIAVVNKDDRERQSQYEELGYKQFEHSDNTKWCYSLIDERVISAALYQRYEEQEELTGFDFRLFVQDIYKNENVGLMAADLICNWIYGSIGQNLLGNSLKESYDFFHNEMKADSYLWSYDKVDDQWRELMGLADKGEIYSFQKQRLKFKNDSNPLNQYYLQHFALPAVDADVDALEKACIISDKALKGDNVEYHLEKDILQEISSLTKKLKDPHPALLYKIYDLLLRVHNHIGDPVGAIDYGRKALEQLEGLPRSLSNIEHRLETLNRMSVIETNRFNFEAAILLLKEEVVSPLVKRLQIADDEKGPLLDPVLGRCYGSLGQNYAFLGRKDEALNAFEQALEHFDSDLGNSEITTAHILHLAIAACDPALFDEYAPGYFRILQIQSLANEGFILPKDNDVIKKNGRNIINGETLSLKYCMAALASGNPYKLLAFVKYINLCDKWSEDRLMDQLLNADYEEIFGLIRHHPWELIFRHLAEISFKSGRKDKGSEWIETSLSVGGPNPPFTLSVLKLGTRMIENLYCSKGKALKRVYQKTLDDLVQLCANEEGENVYNSDNSKSWFYGSVKNVDSKSAVRKKVQRFIGRFTFEYR